MACEIHAEIRLILESETPADAVRILDQLRELMQHHGCTLVPLGSGAEWFPHAVVATDIHATELVDENGNAWKPDGTPVLHCV
jgi:hypothetical protein